MAMGSYLSRITLKVNGLNAQPKDKDWLNGYKKQDYICYIRLSMLSTRDPPQNKGHIQTESEGLVWWC